MNMLRMVPASALDRPTLVALFNEVYTGYEVPMHLDEPAFAAMVKLVDVDSSRSVVGYEDDRPAALASLAIRGERAWIAGMGVVPEFRGRGYGIDVMQAVIDNARAAGARSVDLEVLEGNAPAKRIYEALGFTATRRIVVWLLEPAAELAPAGGAFEIVPLETAAALAAIEAWNASPAPWQRSAETIANLLGPPLALGASRDHALCGAVVYRAASGRVGLLALAAARGDDGALASLIRSLRERHPDAPMRLLNLPTDDPATPVFERLGARAEARQIEMRLSL